MKEAGNNRGSETDSHRFKLLNDCAEIFVICFKTAKDQPICVVKQMKMEMEVRTHKAGYITWLTEVEDNEDVAEGMLAAIVEDSSTQPKL